MSNKVNYKFDDLMNPTLQALKKLGGSGTNEEIFNTVSEILNIPPEQLEIYHNSEKGGMTEIEYRLRWAMTYLKKYELLENSSRGVWALTEKGSAAGEVDQKEIVIFGRAQSKKENQEIPNEEETLNDEVKWQEELLDVILAMSPDAFERLVQRILRESGFAQVEVTGQPGDGGVDGKGILRLGGLLSFHVVFQAKRWKGSVGSAQVRDFRGAMVGLADKGLLITTGTFTKDAIKEATRAGAPPIDLMDGDQLVEKIKQLSLGVVIKEIKVEQVTIDRNWFAKL